MLVSNVAKSQAERAWAWVWNENLLKVKIAFRKCLDYRVQQLVALRERWRNGVGSSDTKCQKCGIGGAALWTLNHEGVVAMINLCHEHSAPLRRAMDLGRTTSAQRNERKQSKPLSPSRVEKRQLFQPLDWEPPQS